MNTNIINALRKYINDPASVLPFNALVIKAAMQYLNVTVFTSFNDLVRRAANQYTGLNKTSLNEAVSAALKQYTGITGGSLQDLINSAAVKYNETPVVVPKTYADYQAKMATDFPNTAAWSGDLSGIGQGAYRSTAAADTGTMVGSSWASTFKRGTGTTSVCRLVQHAMPNSAAYLAAQAAGHIVVWRWAYVSPAPGGYPALNRNGYQSLEDLTAGDLNACNLLIRWDETTKKAYQSNPSIGGAETEYPL